MATIFSGGKWTANASLGNVSINENRIQLFIFLLETVVVFFIFFYFVSVLLFLLFHKRNLNNDKIGGARNLFRDKLINKILLSNSFIQ